MMFLSQSDLFILLFNTLSILAILHCNKSGSGLVCLCSKRHIATIIHGSLREPVRSRPSETSGKREQTLECFPESSSFTSAGKCECGW